MKAKFKSLLVIILALFSISFGQIQPDQTQLSSLKDLYSKYNNKIKIEWNEKNGTPEIISFPVPISLDKNQEISSGKLMKEIAGILKYRQNLDSLVISKQNEKKGIRYFHYQQKYKGIEVKGGQYVVTVLKSGEIALILGSFFKNINVDTKPVISVSDALKAALLNQPEAEKLKEAYQSCKLIIYPQNDKYYLAYEMQIRNIKEDVTWCYIINSMNGEILIRKNDVIYAQANTYLRHPGLDASYTTINPLPNTSNNGYLQGTYAYILNDESSAAYNSSNDFRYSTDNTHFDEGNLYYHVDRIAAYFRNLGFNLFTQITAEAHYDFYKNGNPAPNSGYFDTDHRLRFSDGQGVAGYNSFAREDKIIYHEYTHAVTDYVADLNYDLNYPGQTEAINEGNSDYFAASFTGRNLIGEYVCSFYNRDIANPEIATYPQYCGRWDYPNVEPHYGGEFWSACLWDLRSSLTASVADKIIFDGLSSEVPQDLSFLQYREAILWADYIDYGGSHLNTIKHIFYLRGIGTDAATTSGTLQNNETWTEYVKLSGNVYVPSGKTLTIDNLCYIDLNNYSIISTGGTIVKSSSAVIKGWRARTTSSSVLKGLHSTVQSALDNSSAGYTVDILSGTYNENISVSNKNNLTIAGAIDGSTSLNGSFTANNCNNLFLASATFKQLSVNYCSPCTLWCNIEGDLSQSGLSLYSSNLYNHKGNVYNCTTGLIANSTSGYVEYSDYSSSYCNIYASSGSNITAAYNWFCSGVTYDFSAGSSSYITSNTNHFPNSSPARPYHTGNVTHTADIIDCPARKINIINGQKDISALQTQIDNPAEDEFIKINDSYFALLKKTKDNPQSREVLKNEMPDILKTYKAFIKKNPQSSLSRTALTTTANSYWLTEDNNGRKSFLEEIIADKELTSLKGYVESMMIDNYIKAKDADGAISAADAFMEKYKNDKELICEGLMKKGLVLTYELNQPEKAAECFTAIVKNYPESPLAEFAKNNLAALGQEVKESLEKNTTGEITGFSAGAYPNPFNPSTTIKYSLPENSRVSLEVYNILGEKAASLVNDVKSAGSYSAVFNGSSLASGIYIYKITAVSMQTGKLFVKSDKIMLVK